MSLRSTAALLALGITLGTGCARSPRTGAPPPPAAAPLAGSSTTGSAGPVPTATASAGKASSWATVKVPLFDAASQVVPIAAVEDQAITLGMLNAALAELHGGTSEGTALGKTDFKSILHRLIITRLMVLEARNVGIDEREDFLKEMETQRELQLRETLKRQIVKDLKLDDERFEKTYQDMVKEWKIRSLLFTTEKPAEALRARVDKGESFDTLADKALADQEAQGGGESQFLPTDKLLPQVHELAIKMKIGEVSSLIRVPQGFAIFKVEDVRYPEDSATRAKARRQTLEAQGKELLEKFVEDLVKRDTKSNEARIEKLDLDAKRPGFAAMLTDKRPLVEIKGEAPITVADLADAIQQKLFHGATATDKSQKLNRKKYPMLRTILTKRLLKKEALARGIHLTREFQDTFQDHESSVLFGLFVQDSIVPTLQVTENEAQAYYQAHVDEFSYPEFFVLDGLAFAERAAAEGALAKLSSGTEFTWLKEHAEGQVPEDRRELQFTQGLVSANSLEPELFAALRGVVAGDRRSFTSRSGQFYVVKVLGQIPPKAQPYLEVREAVVKKVYAEKLNQAVESWAAKLESAYKVEVYLEHLGS